MNTFVVISKDDSNDIEVECDFIEVTSTIIKFLDDPRILVGEVDASLVSAVINKSRLHEL